MKIVKVFSIVLLVVFVISSCGKDENTGKSTCDLANPIEELPWLKEIKNSLTNCSIEMSILQGTYKNQTVFYVSMTDPRVDAIQTATLLDCEGKVIEVIKPDKYQTFLDKVSNVKNLYRCKTSN